MLDCKGAAEILRQWDNILVLSHASPDGDTLGCACALIRGLRAMGKRAEFRCADPISQKFAYLFRGLPINKAAWSDPAYHVMTVDVADLSLLGDIREEYENRIELAIDHHGTHKAFTEDRWVESGSAAACELIWLLLKELGVSPDAAIADCVYTGISTDTGCLRYRNANARTYRIAAETLDAGADAPEINRLMWECKSRAQVEAEQLVLDTMEFFADGKCAMVRVPREILERTGAKDDELEGVAALPRQIEGVLIGVTVKEKEAGTVKVSVRSNPPANAADLCAKFDGGGHAGAAGCSFLGKTVEEAAEAMKSACLDYLNATDQP